MYTNKVHLEFDSKSVNERFARVTVAAFATQLNPIMEEISDIKTAVSEAVTNAIVHGYEGKEGTIYMDVEISGNKLSLRIHDDGVGIADGAAVYHKTAGRTCRHGIYVYGSIYG